MKRTDHVVEQKICKEYAGGDSIYDLERKYGVSHTTIWRVLERHRVSRRTLSEAGKRYQVDHHHFNRIDTLRKAYFLGFLAAEAHLRPKDRQGSAQLVVRLALRDEKHLRKLLNEIGSNHPTYIYPGLEHPCCAICIRSDALVEDLHRHGIPYAWGPAEFPQIYPEFYSHFVRGLWDGDGTLTKSSGDWVWKLCGQLPLLSAVQRILVRECALSKTKISKKANSEAAYVLIYGGNKQVPRIVRWMYRNADPSMWLNRKAERAGRCLRICGGGHQRWRAQNRSHTDAERGAAGTQG